jgi:hypothetical protein
MRALIIAIAQDFCATERMKLRRYLVDRLRCELDLSGIEAEAALAWLLGEGWLRAVEISRYDPALEDIATEPAVLAGDRPRAPCC